MSFWGSTGVSPRCIAVGNELCSHSYLPIATTQITCVLESAFYYGACVRITYICTTDHLAVGRVTRVKKHTSRHMEHMRGHS